MNRAVFAGTFNPFTLGHYDIALRASELFDEVIIAVADDSSGRDALPSAGERLDIAQASVEKLRNVKVKTFKGLLIDFVNCEKANIIVRGLRTCADAEYEKNLSAVYKSQDGDIECLYLFSEPKYAHISGSVVRQLAFFGGSLKGYVCESALSKIERCYGKQ